MKQLETVAAALYNVFEQANNDRISDESLVVRLKTICAGSGSKSYWWRYFDNDTAANTWQDVASALKGTRENRKYLRECIAACLETKGLKVHYS